MRGTRAVPFWFVLGVIVAVLTTACGAGPGAAPAGDVAAATSGNSLHLVVVGDAIPSTEPCPECTGFVAQFADHLAAMTGRPVDVDNRSRSDDTSLVDIHDQVLGEERLRGQLTRADVVIVSVGSADVLPDHQASGSCGGDIGGTAASWATWALATTAACQDAARLAGAATYDTILSAITDLRAQQPTKAIALNTYDPLLDDPDFLEADLDSATLDALWAWLTTQYDDWNRLQCARATSRFFDCVDLYHAFNGPAGDVPIGDLSIDGAHPSQAGHDLIAALLAELDLSVLQVD